MTPEQFQESARRRMGKLILYLVLSIAACAFAILITDMGKAYGGWQGSLVFNVFSVLGVAPMLSAFAFLYMIWRWFRSYGQAFKAVQSAAQSGSKPDFMDEFVIKEVVGPIR
ncbi:MAG: hypothetical protein HYU78_00540 [Rhodocyclales bacterium]|nr:hypothetical protein [Rhodocyclales bacterium]